MGSRRIINQYPDLKLLRKVADKDPDLANKLRNVRVDWFKIKNQSEEDVEIAELYIYDEIMPAYMAEWLGGISAQGLIEELNEISASTINVRINSPGGAVFEAIAIYNALVSHSATINVYVDSLAASAASVIAMAGDKVTMMVGSQMMIHDAMGIEMGNAAQLREYADFLDRQSDNIASIYADKAGGETKEFRDLMLAETWLYPEEAVELGLADEVYKRPSNVPEESEEDDGEDAPPAEEGEDPENPMPEEDDEEDPEALMGRKHSIAARGFKYAGRRKAPAPATDYDVDQLVAVFDSFLGGK